MTKTKPRTNGDHSANVENRANMSWSMITITVQVAKLHHQRLTTTTSNVLETERDALLHFKQSIRVDHCGYLYDWGRSQECCQWHGIRCNNTSGHVIGLILCGFVSNNSGFQPCLEGTLSNSLLDIKHLKYLDLSINNFTEALPKFIGSHASLEHLNLSHAGFMGVIPQEIGNLSRLTSLDLKVGYFNMRVNSLLWLSRMRLLREVDLSGIDLSVVTNTWLSIVNNLPSLRKLHLDNCGLSLNSPSSFSYINSSTTLSVLSLAYNNLNNTSIFEWLLNLSGLETNLSYLDLSANEMFGNDVQLSGHAMKLLDNLCSLKTLDLSYTGLNYKFSDIVQSFSSCPHKPLVSLQLSQNQIWGSIPYSIGFFSSLRDLFVNNNLLNGTITKALGRLTMLERLYLSSNSLNGTLTIAHLSNLSKLRELSLSYNVQVVVKISSYWIPPFQLDILNLRSCKIGPYFPRWLLTQRNLIVLDISNANISDTIPVSFWNSSLGPRTNTLDMSHNMFYGKIPDVSVTFKSVSEIHLSSNYFEGEIPSFLRNNVSILYLNKNLFSKGLSTFLCPQSQLSLAYLDLSNNLFSEKFPDCWSYFDQLIALHLESNNLWGNLPSSMGTLHQLNALHLNNNKLSGELPVSLANCKSLVILELANNSLIGHIPPSFGHSFGNLGILSLGNNRFFGGIPASFCDLSQLQLLDLSGNHISGTIPGCLYKLESMTNTDESSPLLEFGLANYLAAVYDDIPVMWKRKEQAFGGRSSLELLKGIDISNNMLEGQIPEGISSLVGLIFLNLSRNNLSGGIMSRIGQLTSLEYLDLSHNHLSGKIPLSLSRISSLAVLDISDNNLSGTIPVGTQLQSFDASSYMGNPGLCGAPLPKCGGDEAPVIEPNGDGKQGTKDNFILGLCISVILGFIIGFWGVFGTLALKRTWRRAFFRFYEDTKDRMCAWRRA